MFEGQEHEKTSEERKHLLLEIAGALIACTVIGTAAVWFFDDFAKYYVTSLWRVPLQPSPTPQQAARASLG